MHELTPITANHFLLFRYLSSLKLTTWNWISFSSTAQSTSPTKVFRLQPSWNQTLSQTQPNRAWMIIDRPGFRIVAKVRPFTWELNEPAEVG